MRPQQTFFQTLPDGCLFQENQNFEIKKGDLVFIQEWGIFYKPNESLNYLLSKTFVFQPFTLSFERAEKQEKVKREKINGCTASMIRSNQMHVSRIISRETFTMFQERLFKEFSSSTSFQARSVLESTYYLFPNTRLCSHFQ